DFSCGNCLIIPRFFGGLARSLREAKISNTVTSCAITKLEPSTSGDQGGGTMPTASKPSTDELWHRLKIHEGQEFETIRGERFTYSILATPSYRAAPSTTFPALTSIKPFHSPPSRAPAPSTMQCAAPPTSGLCSMTNEFADTIGEPAQP